jgi:hypothetical protein
MKAADETPFDSVEGAHEYLGLLSDAIGDAKREVESDIQQAADPKFQRRLDALRLVHFKLEKLEQHVKGGRRILNDLRSLKRLLLHERPESPASRSK